MPSVGSTTWTYNGPLSGPQQPFGGQFGGTNIPHGPLNPQGQGAFAQTPTYLSEQQKHQNELARMQEQSRIRQQQLDQVMRSLEGFNKPPRSVGMGGAVGGVPTTPNAMPREQLSMADDGGAAAAASFARAKDQAGQLAQSALAGLRSSLGGRGLLGSGAEFKGTERIASQGLGALGDLNRERMIQDLENARAFSLANYTGQIEQRGQDLESQRYLKDYQTERDIANLNAQVQQRGQNMSLTEALISGLLNY